MNRKRARTTTPAVDELIASVELLAPTPPWSEHFPFSLAMVDTVVRQAVIELCAPEPGWYEIGRTMLPGGMVRYTFGLLSLAHPICDLDPRAVSPLATQINVDSFASTERVSYYTMMGWLLPCIRTRLNDDQDDQPIPPQRPAGRPPTAATRWLYQQLDQGRDPNDPALQHAWRPLADPDRSYRDALRRGRNRK